MNFKKYILYTLFAITISRVVAEDSPFLFEGTHYNIEQEFGFEVLLSVG